MYLRFGLLGLAITFSVRLARDEEPDAQPATGILGGSTHNFERFVDEVAYEYEEEPEDAFGFH